MAAKRTARETYNLTICGILVAASLLVPVWMGLILVVSITSGQLGLGAILGMAAVFLTSTLVPVGAMRLYRIVERRGVKDAPSD